MANPALYRPPALVLPCLYAESKGAVHRLADGFGADDPRVGPDHLPNDFRSPS